MRTRHVLLTLLIAAASTASIAATPRDVIDPDRVREEQSELIGNLQARKGVFKDLEEPQRTVLVEQHGRVMALIEGKHSPGELSEQERAEVATLLERIDNTVQQAGQERIVCKRVKNLGSHRMEKICSVVKRD